MCAVAEADSAARARGLFVFSARARSVYSYLSRSYWRRVLPATPLLFATSSRARSLSMGKAWQSCSELLMCTHNPYRNIAVQLNQFVNYLLTYKDWW